MAGLLETLIEDPQFQLGIGLLAAGGPGQGSTGQRIAGALQNWQAQQQALQQNKLKIGLLESQIAENKSQDALRRAQLDRQSRQDAYFLGGGFGAPGSASAASPGADSATAGVALKAAAGAPADTPAPSQGKFAEWSKQFGIPVDALVADYFSNGGKGIADMLFKRGTPDMQVTGGYAYDKNSIKPGFLPSLNTSQDGKSTLTLIDPRTGLPSVMPTPGAVGAFSAFQNAAGQAQANWTPETVLGPNGEKVLRSRAEVLGGQPAPGGAPAGYGTEAQMRTTVAGDMGAAPGAAAREIAALRRDREKVPDQASKAAIDAEIARLEGQQAQYGAAPLVTAGNVTELSPAQQGQISAQRTMTDALGRAAAEVVSTSQAGAQSAQSTLQNVQQIRSGLDKAFLGPGANARVALAQIGQVLGVGGKDDAERLSNTRNAIQGLARQELSAAGQMKGQGQITENERAILRRAEAGDISNFTRPELDTLLGALEKTANYRIQSHQNVMEKVRSGASPVDVLDTQPKVETKPAQQRPVFETRPPAKDYKGKRIRDSDTGKIYQSDGLIWKEVG